MGKQWDYDVPSQEIWEREAELEVELMGEVEPKSKYRTEWEEWRADLNSQLYE